MTMTMKNRGPIHGSHQSLKMSRKKETGVHATALPLIPALFEQATIPRFDESIDQARCDEKRKQ